MPGCRLALLWCCCGLLATLASADELVRSRQSGTWSNPQTWAGGAVPADQARVQIRGGHEVVYDLKRGPVIRSIHVAGVLRFTLDHETQLDVGLIKIEPGDDASETGLEAQGHGAGGNRWRSALLIGSASRPLPAGRLAVIRLTPCPGLDPDLTPGIVCRGGRLELHGAPLDHCWLKLSATAEAGSTRVWAAGSTTGWRPGDRVVVTATRRQTVPDEGQAPSVRDQAESEVRIVRAVKGNEIEFDAPLAYRHLGAADRQGEIANISRNIVIESADPAAGRGHVMIHQGSRCSIAYAEFRRLGKTGHLGRYPLHFHKAGDTIRGASVQGASIWDSGNRFLTIHGTNRLVVRDCVGYQSVGHGFFLEDGTEVENILDRCLAIQALAGQPLPNQVLPYDRNEGAGFWWANNRNAFVRNVAVECAEYGFRYEVEPGEGFDPVLRVRGVDGRPEVIDIRTLPFLKFAGNEAHAQRRYGFNHGGGHGDGRSGGVAAGPDAHHPLVIRQFKVWDAHWGITLATPSTLVDGLDINDCEFGLWRPLFDRHAHRNIKIFRTKWAYFASKGQKPLEANFPGPLDLEDHTPPVSVITSARGLNDGSVEIQGISIDNNEVATVLINHQPALPIDHDFSRWKIVLPPPKSKILVLSASARDSAGNVEQSPHRLTLELD